MSKVKLHTYRQLAERIEELNDAKQKQENELKGKLEQVYESFKLKNIIKKTIKDLAHEKEFKEDAFTLGANAIAGFFAKKGFDKIR